MVAEVNSHYVDEYRNLCDTLAGCELPWLSEVREAALQRFADCGFPSPREEEWRYTNVSPIERKRFTPLSGPVDPASVNPELFEQFAIEDAVVLVFVDGRFSSARSRLRDDLPEGIVIAPMSHALATHSELIQAHLGAAVETENNGFIAFNTALFSDGAFVHLPPDVTLKFPVQLLFVSSTDDSLSVARNLVVAETGASAEIFETCVSTGEQGYLAACVSEAIVSENAAIHWTKLQCESNRAFHFGGLYAAQSAYSRLSHSGFSFGGLLVRNEVHADLGRASECHLDGVFLGSRRQHVDNHTRIRHREPHAVSREFYKGILDQRARGVFQGRIIVDQNAQKTDSEMSNRNLLLSDDAEIDTKPQLEIYADDVKCAHGVTVGQLADESVFYLRSRGVDEARARELLTVAFVNEMVEKISNADMRRVVQTQLLGCLPQSAITAEWV